jgi:hypothetical protein
MLYKFYHIISTFSGSTTGVWWLGSVLYLLRQWPWIRWALYTAKPWKRRLRTSKCPRPMKWRKCRCNGVSGSVGQWGSRWWCHQWDLRNKYQPLDEPNVNWLVVWNIFYFPFHIWDVILPNW